MSKSRVEAEYGTFGFHKLSPGGYSQRIRERERGRERKRERD